MQYHEAKCCRICGNSRLVDIFDLGEQYLTGVFPPVVSPQLNKGPVQLVKCYGEDPNEFCGLVQLRQTYPVEQLYGDSYGYRSGLNPSMVRHLQRKTGMLRTIVAAGRGDLILDIGSNDGTLLSSYPVGEATLVGMDPSARKFGKYYRPDIELIADFFSVAAFRGRFGDRKAKIVTSIAMFYDLEQPQLFVNDVAAILADDGIWHFEQSYLPSLLKTDAFDTICHEHIEYYALRQIDWMMRRGGLRIIDVERNNVNGGSFAVTAVHQRSAFRTSQNVELLRQAEAGLELETMRSFEAFGRRALVHRDELVAFLTQIREEKKTIAGYGASTKGNALLQFCGITRDLLPCIAEINEDKFNCVTPGTWIPIFPESKVRAMNPDYFLVLPWHFRDSVVEREAASLANGVTLVFPLPNLELVSSAGTARFQPTPRSKIRSTA